MKKVISLLSLTALVFSGSALQAGLADLFPEKLVDAEGKPVAREVLEGKLIGIYFSAEWCPPCRAFTPSLVQFRNANADAFEVVFVSSDRTEADQKKYMQGYNMDFPAIRHGSAAARSLSQKFSVRGIPFLVIVDSQGNVISTNGRAELTADPQGALAAWQAKAG